jgi:acetate kinase
VNGSRQIQGIDYMESFAPVFQCSTIRMVNTLAAMYNLKGKKIDFTQAFHKKNSKKTFIYGSQPVLNINMINGL